jgi:hypothetical protein
MSRSVRIGNAQAFWGDSPSAASQLLTQVPELDYLTMDYLAEVSMSILAVQRDRDPSKGYAQDFVEVVRGLGDYWGAGGKCRLIANAGGLNPFGCAMACKEALELAKCRGLKIGIVSGDDVVAILKDPDETSSSWNHLDTQQSIDAVRNRILTANAYMGCSGILRALHQGADIVITGRVADPSMVVGAYAHYWNVPLDDWQRLAGATVAGHLLECGTHATGGISTDWLDVPDPAHIGFPIAEIAEDGSCILTKGPGTGGQVTRSTIQEQLVYEISDPARYISPDVIVSFLGLEVAERGADRVSVRGAIGSPPPPTLKVSATYKDGYRAAGMLTIIGYEAVAKAKRCGGIVLQRLQEAGWTFRDSIVECLGAGDSVPVFSSEVPSHVLNECVLRIAVESDSKQAVEAFTREMIPLVTAGPQGTTGYAEGRPSIHPTVRYWPCLIPSNRVHCQLNFIETAERLDQRSVLPKWPIADAKSNPPFGLHPMASSHTGHGNTYDNAPPVTPPPGSQSIPIPRLRDVAYGRSGDKGIHSNIGVIARDADNYQALLEWLTSERVREFFAPMGVEHVERFELPNLMGFNFVVHGILKRSIRNDSQGKALAQALLSMPLSGYPGKHTID